MDFLTIAFWNATLAMTMRLAVPYMYASLGGLIAQHSGIFNCSLEGAMLGGCYFGYLGLNMTGSIWVGLLMGTVFGLLTGWLLAYVSIRFGVNQMVVCLGLNTLCQGICNFLWRNMSATATLNENLLPNINFGALSEVPLLGPMLFQQNWMFYLVLAMFFFYAWFFKSTSVGLSLRSVGENPSAAQTAGINVFRYRYVATILSGAIAAMGGAYLTLSQIGIYTLDMVSGRGWIAVTAISLGKHNPIGVLLASLLFGVANAASNQLQALNIGIPYRVAMMFPYLVALIALIGTGSKKGSHGPAAMMKPFMKNR